MSAPNPGNGTSGRILFMDDEEAIRDIMALMLRRRGFYVTVAGDGREAVAAYGDALARGVPFDAVVLDLAVPGGDGARQAIDSLLRINPGVRALVSSGHVKDPVMLDPGTYGFAGIISKPYTIAELEVALKHAMV